MSSFTRRASQAALLRVRRARVTLRALALGRRNVVASASERDRIPIFLVGCHRSGTSLVRRIVNSHSRLACPAETLFMEHLAAAVDGRDVPDGLGAIGLRPDDLARELEELIRRHMEAHAARKGKRRWADKSPTVINQLDGIDRIFAGEAQYVAIVRDGMDVAHSLGRSDPPWWQLEPWLHVDESNFVVAAHYWTAMNSKLLDFAELHADRVHTVRYEELVADPENTLQQMFGFLGEPWEPEVLRFNDQLHDSGLEDHHVSTTTRIEDHVGKHRRLPLDVQRRMWEVVRPMMLRAGYADRSYAESGAA